MKFESSARIAFSFLIEVQIIVIFNFIKDHLTLLFQKSLVRFEDPIKPIFMSTVKLHRVFSAPPEKVFKAFVHPDAMASWLPPYGFVCKVHSLEAKVGGTYKMSFLNFSTGNSHSFGGEYLEVEPGKKIAYTDRFDDPNLPGEMVTTVTFTAVSCGTEVVIIQEGIPEVIPAEMCYLGWQESLEKLKKLVEPIIPDA